MNLKEYTFDNKLFAKLVDEKGTKLSFYAKKIGVKHASVSNWKRGATEPTLENCKKLADLLGVDYMTLIKKG